MDEIKSKSLPFFAKTTFFLLISFGLLAGHPRELSSANLTSASDTIETSRLSFHGKNNEALTTGSTIIKMATSGTPSTSTANIFPGDTITYTSSSNTYTVKEVIDEDEFSITAGLAAADTDADDEFIIKRTAQHTISFTTANAIANGAIKVRIKADASDFNDGQPDDDGWDFNSISNGDVSCPGDTDEYDFVTGTATVSGGTGCSAGYHCFECRYSGSGNTATVLTMTIGDSTKLINPSPASGHSEGTADTYSVIIENLDGDDAVIDNTTVKVALIESVRVTATVDPIISFSIASLGAGASACGSALDVSTTATTVPFGALAIDSFKNLAQNLTVSTNAIGGYTVTAIQDDQLSIGGEGVVEIPDTVCGATPCSHTSEQNWASTNYKGFGYSLENVDANSIEFEWDDGGGTFTARQFAAYADGGGETTPVAIFSSSTVADSENVYVCYRAVVSATQQAGDYENAITYRATATF
jgi:hypothetical protein